MVRRRVHLSLLLAALAFAAVGCGGGGGGSGGGFPLAVTGPAISAKNSIAVIGSGAGTGATGTSATVIADGVTTAPITVTLLDANGKPVPNAAVVLTGSGAENIIAVSGLSNAQGVVTATIASTKAQTETLTATAISVGTSGATGVALTNPGPMTVTFTQVVSGPAGSSISVSSTSISTDSGNSATVTATIVDDTGAPVANQPVTFSALGGNVTLGAKSATTGANGTAQVSVSSTVAQTGVVVMAGVTPVSGGSSFTMSTAPITFTAGSLDHIAFVNMPTPLAGATFTLEVDFQDKQGNVVNVSQQVVLANPNNPFLTNAALVGPTVYGNVVTQWPVGMIGFPLQTIQIAVGGRARFPGLVLMNAGSYTVGAVATGLPNTSGALTVAPNVATQLGFFQGSYGAPDDTANEPSTIVNGSTFNPVVQILTLDAFGNATTTLPAGVGKVSITVTNTTSNAHTFDLTLGASAFPSSSSGTQQVASLPAANAVALSNGLATFTGLGISLYTANADTFQMTATDTNGVLASGSSPFFNVVGSGQPCQVFLTGVPATLTAGTASATATTVQLADSTGSTSVTAQTYPLTVSLQVFDARGNALGGGTDFSPVSVQVASGSSATFNLQINVAGSGFMMRATASDRNGAGSIPLLGWATTSSATTFTVPGAVRYGNSAPVNVSPGTTVANLAFTQAPDPICGYGTGALAPDYGAGQSLQTIQVSAYDGLGSANGGLGNLVTSFGNAITDVVSLTLTQGSLPTGGPTNTAGVLKFGSQTGSVSNNTSVAVRASNGVATFAGVSIANPSTSTTAALGYGYSLVASAPVGNPTTPLAPVNILPPGQPASLFFMNAPLNPQVDALGLGGPLVAAGSNPNFRVGVKDVTGAVLTTAGAGISVLPGAGSQGLGSPAIMSRTLDNGNIRIGGGGSLPITNSSGVATFEPNVTLTFFSRAASDGAALNVSGSATDGLNNTYAVTNACTAPFDTWPSAPNASSVSAFTDFNPYAFTPHVATGGTVAAANVLTAPGLNPAAGGLAGAPILLLRDFMGNLATTFSTGQVAATVVRDTTNQPAPQVFTFTLPPSSVPVGVSVGDLFQDFSQSPSPFGVISSFVSDPNGNGFTVTVSMLRGTVQPSDWFQFWHERTGANGNRYFFIVQPPTLESVVQATGLTFTVGSSAGVTVGDTIAGPNGAKAVVSSVTPTTILASAEGATTFSATGVTAGTFSVGDTITAAGSAYPKAVVTGVSGTTVTFDAEQATDVTITFSSGTGSFSVGDLVTDGGSGAGVVVSASGTAGTQTVVICLGSTAFASNGTVTDSTAGGVNGAYSGTTSAPTTSWPTGSLTLVAVNAHEGSAGTVSTVATPTWSTSALPGTLLDLTSGKKVTPSNLVATPMTNAMLGDLTGTTAVPIQNGTAVFSNLAITAPALPAGIPWWPYELQYEIQEPTGIFPPRFIFSNTVMVQ